MKVFKSPLPELTLRYKTTKERKVKVSCSSDAFFILKKFYNTATSQIFSENHSEISEQLDIQRLMFKCQELIKNRIEI
jgi:hypothetical protein